MVLECTGLFFIKHTGEKHLAAVAKSVRHFRRLLRHQLPDLRSQGD